MRRVRPTRRRRSSPESTILPTWRCDIPMISAASDSRTVGLSRQWMAVVWRGAAKLGRVSQVWRFGLQHDELRNALMRTVTAEQELLLMGSLIGGNFDAPFVFG